MKKFLIYYIQYFCYICRASYVFHRNSECIFTEINVGSYNKEYLNSLHLPKVYQSLLNKVFEQKFENIKEEYRDSMREK